MVMGGSTRDATSRYLTPTRRLAVAAVAAAVAIAFADSSIVVLALPNLYGRFATSIVGVSWVITSYNVAVAVGAVALLARRRADPVRLSRIGMGVFAAGALGCALAWTLPVLIAFRCLQGAGAALLLAGGLGLLARLYGSQTRGLIVWTLAGTFGAALGPALGGVATQLFDWRAIFALQVPVAALALLVALRSAPTVIPAAAEKVRVAANAALALVSGALVGALFLAVLLVITVWGLSPIAGAAIVSALPVGALVARRALGPVAPRMAAAVGALLLAAGLMALALLPATSPGLVAAAMALCGAGMGLAVPVLTEVATGADAAAIRSGTATVAARHAGLVIALVLVAPLLSHDLQTGGRNAVLGAAKQLLSADVPLRQEVPIALDLRTTISHAHRGTVPNLAAPFDRHGALQDPRLARLRDGVTGAVQDALTRSFRRSLILCALLAALALIPIALVRWDLAGVPLPLPASAPASASARRRWLAPLAVAAAVALIAVELGLGAPSFGLPRLANPCTTRPGPPGGGINGVVERLARSALDGAACELHTTREQLVLSFVPAAGTHRIRWSRQTIDRALRAGLARAAHTAAGNGLVGNVLAFTLTQLFAPSVEWFLQHAG